MRGKKRITQKGLFGLFFLCKSMTKTLMTPTYFTREMEK